MTKTERAEHVPSRDRTAGRRLDTLVPEDHDTRRSRGHRRGGGLTPRQEVESLASALALSGFNESDEIT